MQIEESFIRSIIKQIIQGLKGLFKERIIFENLELKDIFINKKNLNNYYKKSVNQNSDVNSYSKNYANKIDFSFLTLDNAQIKIKNIFFQKEIDHNSVGKLNNLAPEIMKAIAPLFIKISLLSFIT